MKNNKGISLITLLVTVIVIIIIASISVYNGANVVRDARKKDAEDRLRTICSAIFKDDSFLNFNDDDLAELTEDDFDYMDLLKYYDTDYDVTVKKIESGDEDKKEIIYELTMKKKDSDTQYEYSANYTVSKEKYNYNVNFDEENGVNRPILVSGMTAIKEDGTAVEDLYNETWYSYKRTTLSFAKMKTDDGTVYVWIPRFAYSIQSFYKERQSKEVPSTAISIVFLRGTSSYMVNDEVMPETYAVHPAFSKDGNEYSGIWIEKDVYTKLTTLSSVYEEKDSYDAHMMTNDEFGASIYLMYALEAMDEITFEKDEYVAASLIDDIAKFSNSNGFVTTYELDENGVTKERIGDAMWETPWDRVLATYPTEDKPSIMRKFGSGKFDFEAVDGNEEDYCRRAIAVK